MEPAVPSLTFWFVVSGALVDSINPCVFGALIFLLGFMTRIFKSRHMMLFGGLLYTLVVYVTYFALGIGILRVLGIQALAAWFTFIIAVAVIVAGLLEIKDYFWYGAGFTLQIIPGGAKRLKLYTQRIEKLEEKHPLVLLASIVLLGVFVVLIELPCTGGPYIAILNLLKFGEYSTAVQYLLLYNFIFILPLFIIIGMVYLGASNERLETWRKEHRGLMRLFIGLFLVALGIYLLAYGTIPELITRMVAVLGRAF